MRDEIIKLADNLIREKGYNAFSFYDISKTIGIKTASIHYHFPYKSDLGISVIQEQLQKLNRLKQELSEKNPAEKLEGFFDIYSRMRNENKICLVGSLATDYNTLDVSVQGELKVFAKQVLQWITEILAEGRKKRIFWFNVSAKTKAMMIISTVMAIVQLSRLSKRNEFELIKNAIIKELTYETN